MTQEEPQTEQATPPVESQPHEQEPKIEPADNSQPGDTGIDWESMARRLQADMENFRKRQRRQADEAAQVERERLLRLVLPVADNLARALNHQHTADDQALRQGIELTQRELNRLLQAEGVSRIETVGQAFDPQWHEALASLPAQGVASNTVVEEIEAGYRLEDKLLRPAKVVVAA